MFFLEPDEFVKNTSTVGLPYFFSAVKSIKSVSYCTRRKLKQRQEKRGKEMHRNVLSLTN